jgi:hypothetical protein
VCHSIVYLRDGDDEEIHVSILVPDYEQRQGRVEMEDDTLPCRADSGAVVFKVYSSFDFKVLGLSM